jgi:cytoskeletal protein RodZ
MTEAQVTEPFDTESPDSASAGATASTASSESHTPGSVLRRAREARGQSIADVVQVIRFSARQIEALERDDYASLPGSTAVRGLVRNYAKFLKLDATPLLAQLEPAVPVPEADVRPPANMGEAEDLTIIERVPLQVIAGGTIVLLAALAAYWYSALAWRWPDDTAATQHGTGSARPIGAFGHCAFGPPDPAVVVGNEPASAGVPSSLPTTGGLRVEFDDRSWIEIRDATQKIVFVGEYPAGTRQKHRGQGALPGLDRQGVRCAPVHGRAKHRPQAAHARRSRTVQPRMSGPPQGWQCGGTAALPWSRKSALAARRRS